ncbi:MAG: FAD-binding oxidoreductase [Spirochaetales bacterium]|nr:FAD-binding oxidoreductase [Spirochaetales bacterium]
MISRQSFDAVILGAGIIGLASAYYLGLRGKKVLVLEAGGFGHGSSGACDDMILLQSKKPGINLQLSFKSLELYRQMVRDWADEELDFLNLGGMILIQTPEELTIMEEFVQQQRDNGLDVTILDKKEMKKYQPFVSDQFIASTYSSIDSQVSPFAVMRGYLRRIKQVGGLIRFYTPVKGIKRGSSGTWAVETRSGETVSSEVVVNAAGAWAGNIGHMVGEYIPITPKKGQLVITEKVPPVGKTNLWSARYMVTKLRPDLVQAEGSGNGIGLSFSFTRTGDGNYLIGSTREKAGYVKENSYEALQAVIRQAVDFIPTLRQVHFIRTIAGFRPATEDGLFILGEHADSPGFFTAAGHEGDGIALAPITGKILSEMVCGDSLGEELTQLSPNRFQPKEKIHG